jgi:hypothetical protein
VHTLVYSVPNLLYAMSTCRERLRMLGCLVGVPLIQGRDLLLGLVSLQPSSALATLQLADHGVERGGLLGLLHEQVGLRLELRSEAIGNLLLGDLHLALESLDLPAQPVDLGEEMLLGVNKSIKLLLQVFNPAKVFSLRGALFLQQLHIVLDLMAEVTLLESKARNTLLEVLELLQLRSVLLLVPLERFLMIENQVVLKIDLYGVEVSVCYVRLEHLCY